MNNKKTTVYSLINYQKEKNKVTRQADIKSDKYLSFKAKSIEDFQKVKDAKILAHQDGLEVYDLMSEALDLLFKKHHWPPGNPQTLLLEQDKIARVEKCKCGKPASAFGLHVASGKDFKFCAKCFREVPQRHDPKIWCFSADSLTAKRSE